MDVPSSRIGWNGIRISIQIDNFNRISFLAVQVDLK